MSNCKIFKVTEWERVWKVAVMTLLEALRVKSPLLPTEIRIGHPRRKLSSGTLE